MVGGRFDANPGQVIEALRRDASEHHEHAMVVADFLDEMRERMSLLIPEHDADPYAEARDDRLTVLTMAGLTLPKDGVGREFWTDAESLGVELLNLAAWLTQRSIYERPKDLRKGVWIDEAFFLSEVPTGRVLMNRFARDSRKWNVRVLLSSQIPADFLRIQGFVALLDSMFVGRLDDDERPSRRVATAQGAGRRRLRAGRRQSRSPAGRDRGMTERDVSPRQFIFGDGAGGVERIRIDFSGPHLEHLRTAMDTTPDAMRESDRNKAALPGTQAEPVSVPHYVGDPEGEFDTEFEAELGLVDELVPTPADHSGRHGGAADAERADRDDTV